MASNSASGSKLAELEQELKGLKAQKAAELNKEKGTRDLELLVELNKDLDRTQAAITALSSGELHFRVSALPHTPLWYSLAVCKGIQLVCTTHPWKFSP